VHILLARAALRLSDLNLARALLNKVTLVLKHAPGLAVLEDWLSETLGQLEAVASSESTPPARMTAAELRILHYLPTHLVFHEIAERMQLSTNTVKSQAKAVYRKFGVTCRSDAVARARSCGLLDD
jgi:LuxR family transcriptional regulator, maltose regulon positive regulatory protein